MNICRDNCSLSTVPVFWEWTLFLEELRGTLRSPEANVLARLKRVSGMFRSVTWSFKNVEYCCLFNLVQNIKPIEINHLKPGCFLLNVRSNLVLFWYD